MKKNQIYCCKECDRLDWIMQNRFSLSGSTVKAPRFIMDSAFQLCLATCGCQLQTLQESSFLDALTNDQERKYVETLEALVHQSARRLCRATVTYRGVSHNHLQEKLSANNAHLDEDKLLSLLFYFGDKARHNYKLDDAQVNSLRWLKSIEDNSRNTCSNIFKKINNILKKNRSVIAAFKEKNNSFFEYFNTSDNREKFVDAITDLGVYARDYYLYFLHSFGNVGLGDNSVLVSTSTSYDIAKNFAGECGKRYVICYVIPHPISRHAVTFRKMKESERQISERGLPTYKGVALYPKQREYCVRGALFASRILGVRVLGESRFVLNPHMFSMLNIQSNILCGLILDQSEFEKKLNHTNYYRGVGIHLDGTYGTIFGEEIGNEQQGNVN